MKVVLLIPCLMLDNNRAANHKAMRYAKENYNVDEIVVNDQCFSESDYEEGFTYIGHHDERQGFVRGRNQLLEWFYNSDADYAIWIDGNARVSKTTLNDFRTLVDVTKRGDLPVDVVFSTLGIYVSGERIEARKREDHREKIRLVKAQGCDWFHAMFLANLKKKYGIAPMIDERCDPKKGVSEDVYFARLLRRIVSCRQCPTIIVSKPSNKTSTWIAGKDGYKYEKIDYATVDQIVSENIKKAGWEEVKQSAKSYEYERVEAFRDMMTSYKPPKKPKGGLLK